MSFVGEHRITGVSLCGTSGECPRCTPDTPHNVVARCSCGQTASGKTEHIWTVASRSGDLVSLTPSFNWLVDPNDPSQGSHLHETVSGVRAMKLAELHE